ncbi:MAG: DUF2157 domain-containing protein [Cyanobacteriota bacterium]
MPPSKGATRFGGGRQRQRWADSPQPAAAGLARPRGMASHWQKALQRWLAAELIDPATVTAIERWEAAQPMPRLRAPILVCLALGAVLLGAGALLFVAAHWDTLAPSWRFTLVMGLLLALHGLAAWSASGFPALAMALHAVGSVALGGGIFLVGQIFNLQAHWPGGLLLWGLGAGLGWLLLRQWPQLALLALLAPVWLMSEWLQFCRQRIDLPGLGAWTIAAIPCAGVLLLCLTYLGAPRGSGADPARRALLWLGGLGLFPAAVSWITLVGFQGKDGVTGGGLEPLRGGLPLGLAALGWSVAIGGPLLLGWWLRGRGFWPLAVAAGWILASVGIGHPITPWSYAWTAIGGLLLVAWGLRESRAERINLGTAAVAITIVTFYFAEVMDKLERSLSLILLGLLCLLGGLALERLRRRMVGRLSAASQRLNPARERP